MLYIGSFYYDVIVCFFFQAEDGIRDLVRSRGLGDVYKRQVALDAPPPPTYDEDPSSAFYGFVNEVYETGRNLTDAQKPVSYTHLTLPTSDLV